MMEFYDVLDQVLNFFRGRGRVSYRTLKLQFYRCSENGLLSRDRKSSEQFTGFNCRDHEIKAE
jgi:hypothetical protein